MFCKSCGNKLNQNDSFCSSCGNKIEKINNNQSIDTQINIKEEKTNFFLSNLFVFQMYMLTMVLLFIEIIVAYFKSLANSSAASGFFLLIIPFIAAMYVIPHCIGTILGAINLKVKKYGMIIAMFIFSIISILMTIGTYDKSNVGNNGFMFWVSLILSIVLNIVLLLKLILKNKK